MSFFEFFTPGLRFLREEQDRQKMLVTERKFGKKGGPLGIDLESGKATFSMPPHPDGIESEDADEALDDNQAADDDQAHEDNPTHDDNQAQDDHRAQDDQ